MLTRKTGIVRTSYRQHDGKSISLDLEVFVGDVKSLSGVLVDAEHANDTTRAAITVGSKRDGTLEELLSLLKGHVGVVVGVEVSPDEGGA